jgi:3-oxoacyl-[acyl-carrier-protein] synthase II
MSTSSNVCISAYGAVTPIGSTLDEISKNLQEGNSGIRAIKKFDTDTFKTKWAGVPELGNDNIRWPRETRQASRPGEMLYADVATEQLVSEFNPLDHYDPSRIGCVIGVDEPSIDPQRCVELTHKVGSENCNKRDVVVKTATEFFRVSEMMDLDVTSVLKTIQRRIPFSGYTRCHVGLCSASLQALGMARQAILDGKADAMIVGGVSAKITPFNLAQLEAVGAVCTDPNLTGTERSRPFDRRRSGFMPAEGSVLFILEKESAVKARGGTNYCNLLGYGASLAAQHIVAPHTEGREMYLAMTRALDDSNVDLKSVDCINAHGTSTKLNDLHETTEMRRIFGEDQVPYVTSTKSMHGHLIASAGAMEVLGVMASFRDSFIPGVLNLENQDPEIKVPVVAKTKSMPVNTVLKNSFGMGGLAASMVLQNPTQSA